ncbi:proteasome subunit beta [Pseudomonas marginalis]|jgi:hypothetical protein|uniref:proteasome subunit beta n=1 Tax=Pseudomonas marginalis TaxID=298 RepID=UPI002034905B|nr:proteasome subunit beta [Pseudomonas marginalis]MCM2379710.1 proteasome subunit beta [Pseudomonas marginalis]
MTTITDDDCEKLETVNGMHFFRTGGTCDFDALIAAYFGTTASAPVEASGYAVDGGTLWLIAHDDKTGFWKNRIRLDRVDAIGNGSPFALTAMDMGATAVEVIEMAQKRDTCTGGQVRMLVVLSDVYSQTAMAVRAT